MESIKGLPQCTTSLPLYLQQLTEQERDLFTTLLPLAAFIRRTNQDISLEDLIYKVKESAIKEIAPFLRATAT
jgi:hypothetical protein